MTDDRDIFDDESTVTTTEGVSPEAPEPARDDKGRFAAKDTGDDAAQAAPAQATPAAENGAPPAPVEKKEPHLVPLATVLDDREKRQRAEAERDDYKRRIQEMERQIAAFRQPQQPPQLPDVVEKPEEFAALLMQQQRAQIDNLEAGFSERIARKEYGNEAVDAALDAARSQNVLGHFTRGPDRWERMCEWHKQQLVAAEIGNDPAAYRAKILAEAEAQLREKLRAEIEADLKPNLKAQIEAEHAAAAELSTRPKAPRSLAAAPGSGYAPPAAGGDPLFD